MYSNTTDDFKFERYLGGYYRDYIPKLPRRIKRRIYDKDVTLDLALHKNIQVYPAFFLKFTKKGNVIYDEEKPDFHKGFPSSYKICHRLVNTYFV